MSPSSLAFDRFLTGLLLRRLAVSGLAYVFYILVLPKWGNYSIRQFLEKLPDGAQATKLVKVPNSELAEWDATHDKHGDFIGPQTR